MNLFIVYGFLFTNIKTARSPLLAPPCAVGEDLGEVLGCKSTAMAVKEKPPHYKRSGFVIYL